MDMSFLGEPNLFVSCVISFLDKFFISWHVSLYLGLPLKSGLFFLYMWKYNMGLAKWLRNGCTSPK